MAIPRWKRKRFRSISTWQSIKNEETDQRSYTGFRKRAGRYQRSADGRGCSGRSRRYVPEDERVGCKGSESNGTNFESDCTAIQSEIDQLTTKIDRVSETTKFNETYLLKGDKDALKGYTYSYGKMLGTYRGDDAGATFTSETATGISLEFTKATTTDYSMDAQNEFLNAIRDSGVSITAESVWDDTDSAAKNTTYAVELNGTAKKVLMWWQQLRRENTIFMTKTA